MNSANERIDLGREGVCTAIDMRRSSAAVRNGTVPVHGLYRAKPNPTPTRTSNLQPSTSSRRHSRCFTRCVAPRLSTDVLRRLLIRGHQAPLRTAIGVLVYAAIWSASLRAEPVPVLHPEGLVHGFLTLRTRDGALVANGDLI